jgi:hypothetical protein
MYGFILHLTSNLLLLIQSYKDQGEKNLKTWIRLKPIDIQCSLKSLPGGFN